MTDRKRAAVLRRRLLASPARASFCIVAAALLGVVAAAETGGLLSLPEWPAELQELTNSEAQADSSRRVHSERSPSAEAREAPQNSRIQQQSDAHAAKDASTDHGKARQSAAETANGVPLPKGLPTADSADSVTENPRQLAAPTNPGELASGDPSHPDPVTASRIRLLQESGLLGRQAEISESIIMMERQLKQAELLNRLLALRGPDTLIEIAPGRFESFADTPEGRRLSHQIEENELKARIRILELRLQEASLKAALSPTKPKPAPEQPASEQAEPLPAPGRSGKAISVLEVFGRNDRHSAILDLGGMGIQVEAGDTLPDGSKVRSVSSGGVVIVRDGHTIELNIDD